MREYSYTFTTADISLLETVNVRWGSGSPCPGLNMAISMCRESPGYDKDVVKNYALFTKCDDDFESASTLPTSHTYFLRLFRNNTCAPIEMELHGNNLDGNKPIRIPLHKEQEVFHSMVFIAFFLDRVEDGGIPAYDPDIPAHDPDIFHPSWIDFFHTCAYLIYGDYNEQLMKDEL